MKFHKNRKVILQSGKEQSGVLIATTDTHYIIWNLESYVLDTLIVCSCFASGSSLYGRMVQELYCFIFTSNGPGENIYILKFIQKYEEVVEVVQACNM